MSRIKTTLAIALLSALPICSFSNPSNAQQIHFGDVATAAPSWILDQTIYEVNVRQFSESGTFTGVEKELDRIKELGIGTLWLMPIHPIGEVNRKGPLGSYYSVANYTAVNPEFGTDTEFRSLVKAAHARGMRVILDWVANHTAWENPLTRSNPEYYAHDPEGKLMPPHGTDWTDVVQLDFNNRKLWQTMIDAMAYWVNEYEVDGFRCDYAAGVPVAFWDEASRQLRAINPELFLLAESFQGDLNLNAFHASYGWERHHAFNAIAQGKAPASHLDDVLARERLFMPADTLLLNFTSNHDENTWAGTTKERMGDAKRAFDLLAFTLPGIPLIYNGQEASMNKRLEFFRRDPIDWTNLSESEFYRSLAQLKQEVSALHGTSAKLHRIPSTANEKVFAFGRSNETSNIIVFVNLSNEAVQSTAASSTINGSYTSYFSGQKLRLENIYALSLEPWAFEVLIRD